MLFLLEVNSFKLFHKIKSHLDIVINEMYKIDLSKFLKYLRITVFTSSYNLKLLKQMTNTIINQKNHNDFESGCNDVLIITVHGESM